MAKKKTVNGKSLNTLDNFEKAHECDCDHNHEENGRRCECCGEECPLTIIQTVSLKTFGSF